MPNSALSEVCCYLSAGTWINLNVGGNGGLPTISSSGDSFDWSMSSSAWVSTSAPDANGFVTVVYASDGNNSSVLTSSCYTGEVVVTLTYIPGLYDMPSGDIDYQLTDLNGNLVYSSVSALG